MDLVILGRRAHGCGASSTFLHLGSALAHVGQLEEARAAIRRLLELAR